MFEVLMSSVEDEFSDLDRSVWRLLKKSDPSFELCCFGKGREKTSCIIVMSKRSGTNSPNLRFNG
jgi:hypothetical protein